VIPDCYSRICDGLNGGLIDNEERRERGWMCRDSFARSDGVKMSTISRFLEREKAMQCDDEMRGA